MKKTYKDDRYSFIWKAIQVHGYKYDYSEVVYVNSRTKVKIICPVHGAFWITPNKHLMKRGCPKCGRVSAREKLSFTTDKIVKIFKLIHGNRYDYSKVRYVNMETKVCIICPEHGEFWQQPIKHILGQGCPKCAKNMPYTNETIIMAFRCVHGDRYDYSKVKYVNVKTKVCIICKEHGEFWQTPESHLKGCGCPKCCGKNKTTEDVIKEFRVVHGDRYIYDKVIYSKANEYVIVICPIHGVFLITPNKHLNGRGCPKCAIEYKASLRRKPLDCFINEAKDIHGNDFDYSYIEKYVNTDTKVKIKCNKCGRYFYQTPNHHLHGDGCPYCKQSKMEKNLMKLFEDNNIEYIHQCKFGWLKYKKELPLDFYLPKYNIAVECQGIQHFDEKHYFNEVGRYSFANAHLRDKIKFNKCLENNVKLLYICNEKDFNVENAIENAEYFFDFGTLLTYIKDKGEILS